MGASIDTLRTVMRLLEIEPMSISQLMWGSGFSRSIVSHAITELIRKGLVADRGDRRKLDVIQSEPIYMAVQIGSGEGSGCAVRIVVERRRTVMNAETCYNCGGKDLWSSRYVEGVCRRCHPPTPGAEHVA